MRRALVWMVVVCGACGACARASSDDPVEVYQAFVKNTQKGEAKAAYASLSEKTRSAIDERTRALSDASDGGVRNDPESLFFAQVQRPAPVTEISLERRDASGAVLKVTSAERVSEIHMVKEDGAWKLDLTDSVK